MINNINSQLVVIENSIKWISETDAMSGKKGEILLRGLVKIRRQLKKKKIAVQSKSAAAVYGESQVGKSYLINSLLSNSNEPFSIRGNDNVIHNFIKEINPQGGGMESTSLVTRFSSTYEPSDSSYPVKAVLLSPADVILMLADCYYNDVKIDHDSILGSEDVKLLIDRLNEKYGKSSSIVHQAMDEDDIWEIQDYFKNHFSTKSNSILNSDYFSSVSLLINRIPSSEWIAVFEPIWNNNKSFSSLFQSIIELLAELNFADELFLPIDAVLSKYGTVLDIQRLKELNANYLNLEEKYKKDTEVLCKGVKKVVPKSYLCVIVAEIVFSVNQANSESKPFLKDTDLLDFPGARARMAHPSSLIDENTIPELLIRGKVSYLFHKYSQSEKISIFLLCAKHEQTSQRSMPEMLNNWVRTYIGNDPDERGRFLTQAVVPPLFIVSTFFNENLAYNPNQDRPGNIDSLNYRWKQRFDSTLSTELLDATTYDWLTNWTSDNRYFQNIYLLRDFVYSESKSIIFRGFESSGCELEEVVPSGYPDFRQKLKESFMNHSFVINHFKNPEISWDRAAAINEDGSTLIIEKLTLAAANIKLAKEAKWKAELSEFRNNILTLLNEHYNSSDKSENLEKAKQQAGLLQSHLDISFSRTPHFFGPLLSHLMIPSSVILNEFRLKMGEIEHRNNIEVQNDSTIKLFVTKIDINAPFDVNLEYLREYYNMTSAEECRANFEDRGIDLNELFYGDFDRVKNSSQVLAESIVDFWMHKFLPEKFRNLKQYFSESEIENIIEVFEKMSVKIDLKNHISKEIWHHINGFKNIDDVYDMISDITAQILNKLIVSFGTEYLSDGDMNDLILANERNSLDLHIADRNNSIIDTNKERIAEVVSRIGNLKTVLAEKREEEKKLPHFANYVKWRNNLKIGFIYVCDIPNYDIMANNKLGNIMNECVEIKD